MRSGPNGHAELPWLVDTRWVVAGVLALIAVVYLPVLRFHLVYDDGWTLMANGFLRTPQDLWLLLTPEAETRNVPDAFRPTLVAFDTASYWALGLSAPLHHATSLALHLLVCWLLQRWLRVLGAPALPRILAMGLFGLLAIHAEVVAVVSFREDLLATALGLLAILAVHRGLGRPLPSRVGWWTTAGGVQALACGAKLSAAGIPLLWLLTVSWAPWRPAPRWRTRTWATCVLVVGTVLVMAHRWILFGQLSPYGADNLRLQVVRSGLGPVLAQSAQIHLGYLQQILVPLGLSPEYVDTTARLGDPTTVTSMAALGALLAYGVWAGGTRRRPVAAIAIVGGFLLAMPTSNLFPMPNMRADRFMYLPTVPVCVGLGWGVHQLGTWLQRRWGRPALLLAPAVIYGVLQGAAAQAAARVYRSDLRLWEIALRRAPDSPRAHAMAGLLRIGAIERSRSRRGTVDPRLLARLRAHCVIAERLDPHYELPQLCFARLAVARLQWTEAYRRFGRALALSPDRNQRILASMAQVALDLPPSQGDGPALALQHLERGLHEYPYAADLVATAGRIHHRLGHPKRALHYYRRARRLRPERWEVVAWGLELALDLGDAAAARQLWTREHELLEDADPALRASLQAKLKAAKSLPPPNVEILSAGVFPR